jgi:hypothetical protein
VSVSFHPSVASIATLGSLLGLVPIVTSCRTARSAPSNVHFQLPYGSQPGVLPCQSTRSAPLRFSAGTVAPPSVRPLDGRRKPLNPGSPFGLIDV